MLFLNRYCIFLQHFYKWPKRWYVVLNATYDESLLIMAYLMASLHSLVDGLRMKNRRHQKKGATTFWGIATLGTC